MDSQQHGLPLLVSLPYFRTYHSQSRVPRDMGNSLKVLILQKLIWQVEKEREYTNALPGFRIFLVDWNLPVTLLEFCGEMNWDELNPPDHSKAVYIWVQEVTSDNLWPSTGGFRESCRTWPPSSKTGKSRAQWIGWEDSAGRGWITELANYKVFVCLFFQFLIIYIISIIPYSMFIYIFQCDPGCIHQCVFFKTNIQKIHTADSTSMDFMGMGISIAGNPRIPW